MSGLLFLQAGDFSVQAGSKGDILCNSIRGISLILFYSTRCQYSQALIPIFKGLPGTIGGCQFGMINVTNERDIITMSSSTVAPIQYVPLIIMFVNGKPFIRYDGPHEGSEIRKFLVEVTSKLQTKDKFFSDSARDAAKGHNSRGIPEFTVGYPLFGQEDDFYLEFDEAYPK
jgi:thioredoxin-like negative regulator of GroEL